MIGHPDRLMAHAKRLDVGAVFKRLGFLAHMLGFGSPSWLAECERHLSAGVSKLDPHGRKWGPIVGRWRLRLNVAEAAIVGGC